MKTHSTVSLFGTLIGSGNSRKEGGPSRRVMIGVRTLFLLLLATLLAAPLGFANDDPSSAEAKADTKSSADQAKKENTATADDTKTDTKDTAASDKININTASAKALESLPGIGPALSARIVEARPYEKIEDIKKVKGIGEKTFEKIKARITVK